MNPYKIDGPAVVSFSGGRTSGFMLWNILEAHGGKLPEDIKVVFCNTGLEHPETYNFINRLEAWTPITWLEYCLDPEYKHSFKIIDFESSSRDGSPFRELIFKNSYKNGKPMMPNSMMRICTAELKVRTMRRYLKSLGWEEWDNCVGLRADEPRRVAKIKYQSGDFSTITPMADAGHDNFDVQLFWKNHQLDLKLPLNSNIFGNCCGCFLKGVGKLEAIAREQPELLHWWRDIEKETGQTFKKYDRPNYSQILRNAHLQLGFDFGDSIDCFCTD